MGENIIYIYLSLLAGLGAIGYGMYKAYHTWNHKRWIDNAKNWPVTNGKVTRTQLNYTQNKNSKHYYAVIGYAYTVTGSKYEGSIRKEEFFSSESAAKACCSTHGEGSVFEVHYNPMYPDLHVVDFDNVNSCEIYDFALPIIIGLVFVIYSWSTLNGK